jgi:hypothetical protein
MGEGHHTKVERIQDGPSFHPPVKFWSANQQGQQQDDQGAKFIILTEVTRYGAP